MARRFAVKSVARDRATVRRRGCREVMKVWLAGDQCPKFGIELECQRELIERLGAIARQAPVARQIIV